MRSRAARCLPASLFRTESAADRSKNPGLLVGNKTLPTQRYLEEFARQILVGQIWDTFLTSVGT